MSMGTAKERPGLVEYLERKLGKSAGRGAERHFHCPFCIDRVGSESSARKLDVNIRKGVASCYRCGFKGNLDRIFRTLNRGTLTIEEAALCQGEVRVVPKETLKGTVREMLKPEDDGTALLPEPPPKETIWLADPKNARLGANGLRYFLGRRALHPSLIAKYNVGYCATGEYANRLVFPVYQGGSAVYFSTRYCGDHVIKAKNPEWRTGHLAKTDVIWNYDGLVGKPIVVICEGVISAMAFEDAGALFGKTISPRQIQLILDLVPHGLEEVIVALDPDAGRYAESIYYALNGKVPLCSVLYLDYGDPDERRADLPRLLEGRQAPTLRSRVRSRFVVSK